MLTASQLGETVMSFPSSHIVPRLFLPKPHLQNTQNENKTKAGESCRGGGGRDGGRGRDNKTRQNKTDKNKIQTPNQSHCNQRCEQKKVPVACCTQKSKGNN